MSPANRAEYRAPFTLFDKWKLEQNLERLQRQARRPLGPLLQDQIIEKSRGSHFARDSLQRLTAGA